MSRPRTSRLSSAPRAFRLPRHPLSRNMATGTTRHVNAYELCRSLGPHLSRIGATVAARPVCYLIVPHARGRTPAHFAAQPGHAGCLRALHECLSSMIQSNLLCVCPRLSLTDTRLRGATPCTRHAHRATLLPMSYSTMDPPWRGATYADGSGIGAEDVSRVEVVDEPDSYGVGVAFAGTAERHAYGSGAPCDVRFRGSDTGRV